MGQFYCPTCDKYVSAPHFCDSDKGKGGAGFKVNLTPYIFPVKPSEPWPDVPKEYTDALAENEQKLKDGLISQEDHDLMCDHIKNLISLYRRINGKEDPSCSDF